MTEKKRRGLRARCGFGTQAQLEVWDDRLAFVVGVIAAVIILTVAAGMVAMLVRIYTRGALPATASPLTEIFASRLMLAAARLAILFVGIYIVLSVLMHMRRGQWLTAAGPLKVAEAARKVTSDLADRREDLRLALKENERLKATVSDVSREARVLEQLLQQAQAQLRRSG